MKQIADYNDVLSYLYSEELPDNFQLAWSLLYALLPALQASASDEALNNVTYFLDDERRAWLLRLAEAANRVHDAESAQAIDEELYHAQKEPRYGESNPELLNLAFWKFMIRRRLTAWGGRMEFDPACQAYMTYLTESMPAAEIGKLNEEEMSARFAKAPPYELGNAVWSYRRFGASSTLLPDGREICIGGEHEDWYDCDFHIYNDVIVIHPNLEIDIYCYPRMLFKPTDFHSATLVGNSIYIIGCLGYFGTREPGVTPVYRLDCATIQIEKVETSGENPGWIYNHDAEYVPERNAIKVTQGKVFLRWEGKRTVRKNRKRYWLDLATGQWSSGNKNAG